MAKGKLRKISEQLKKGYKEQDDEFRKIIDDNDEVILDLNRRQLMSGIDAKGKSLGDYKNPSYALMKKTLNPKGVVDLNLTGDFHDSMLLVNNLPIEIDAFDGKTNDLKNKYGQDIFGLTKESRKILAVGYIKERLINYYRRLLHL